MAERQDDDKPPSSGKTKFRKVAKTVQIAKRVGRKLPSAVGTPTRADPAKPKTAREQERHERIFTHWAANLLQKHGIEFTNIADDIRDGIKLMKLVEILTGEQLPRPKPADQLFERIANINIALDCLRRHGLNLDHLSGNDLAIEDNQKSALSLMWQIVLNLAVDHESDKDTKSQLLSWTIEKTADNPKVTVTNLHSSWMDGLVLCTLIHSYFPDSIDLDKLDPNDPERNVEIGLAAAKSLGLPFHFSKEDILESPNERTTTTIVATLYNILEAPYESATPRSSVTSVSPRHPPKDSLRQAKSKKKRRAISSVQFEPTAKDNSEKLGAMRKVFDQLDTDQAGHLTLEQVAELVQDRFRTSILPKHQLGPATSQEFRKILSPENLTETLATVLNVEPDHSVDFQEFVAIAEGLFDARGQRAEKNLTSVESFLLTGSFLDSVNVKDQLQSHLEDAEKEVEKLNLELETRVQNYEEDISEIQKNAEATKSTLTKEKQKLSEQVEALEAQLNDRGLSRSSSIRSEDRQARQENEKNIKDLTKELASLRQENVELMKELSTKDAELEHLTKSLTEEKNLLDQAMKSMEESKWQADHIQSIEAENHNLKSQLREMEEKLDEEKALRSRHSGSRSGLTSPISSTAPRSLEDELTKDNASRRRTSLGGDNLANAARAKEIVQLKAKIRKLEADMKDAVSAAEFSALKKQYDDNKAALNRELEQLRVDFQESQTELKKTQKKLQSSESKAKNLEADAAAFRTTIAELKSANDDLLKDNDKLRKSNVTRSQPSTPKLLRSASRNVSDSELERIWKAIQELRDDQGKQGASQTKFLRSAMGDLDEVLQQHLNKAEEERQRLQAELQQLHDALAASQQFQRHRQLLDEQLGNAFTSDKQELAKLRQKLADSQSRLDDTMSELQELKALAHVEIQIVREVIEHRKISAFEFQASVRSKEHHVHQWFKSPDVDKLLPPHHYPWNKEEDDVIKHYIGEGSSYLDIAKQLPGRTDSEIQRRYEYLMTHPDDDDDIDGIRAELRPFVNETHRRMMQTRVPIRGAQRRRPSTDLTSQVPLMNKAIDLDDDVGYATSWANTSPYVQKLQRQRRLRRAQEAVSS